MAHFDLFSNIPTGAMLGIDIAPQIALGRAVTRQEAAAIKQVGYEIVVVNLHGGYLPDSAKAQIRDTIDNVQSEGLLTAGYIYIWHRNRLGQRRGPLQVQAAFDAIGASRWNDLQFVAIDIEKNVHPANTNLHQVTPEDLRQSLNRVSSVGTAPAWIYCGSGYYNGLFSTLAREAATVTSNSGADKTFPVNGRLVTQRLYPSDNFSGGDSSEFSTYPLWDANWGNNIAPGNPSFEIAIPFGGFSERSGHQYLGDVDNSGRVRFLQLGNNQFSSLRVDYNIFKRSALGVTTPAPPIRYTPPVGQPNTPVKFIDGGNYVPEVPTTAKQLIYVLGTSGTYRLIFEG